MYVLYTVQCTPFLLNVSRIDLSSVQLKFHTIAICTYTTYFGLSVHIVRIFPAQYQHSLTISKMSHIQSSNKLCKIVTNSQYSSSGKYKTKIII